MFTEKEIAYLKSQRLVRIGTVSEDLQPHVEPVGFDFDGEYFYVSGYRLTKTRRHRNVQVNSKVALTFDDLPLGSTGNHHSWHGRVDFARRLHWSRYVYSD